MNKTVSFDGADSHLFCGGGVVVSDPVEFRMQTRSKERPGIQQRHGRMLTIISIGSAIAVGLFVPLGYETRAAEPAQVTSRVVRAGMTAMSLDSGPPAGDYVPTFYSRVVTGPLMNKTVCYVCRNGQRPVVAVFVRSMEPKKLKLLLRNIDRVVDRNRDVGLRSFGVLLCDNPFRNVSTVQTFSFNNKIAMPITVATNSVAAPSCQNIHSAAAVTVVLYRRRRVETTFAFRDGEMTTDKVRTIINRIRQFAGETVDDPRTD